MMSQVRKSVALRTSFEHMNWITELETAMVMDLPSDAVQERQRDVIKTVILLDDGQKGIEIPILVPHCTGIKRRIEIEHITSTDTWQTTFVPRPLSSTGDATNRTRIERTRDHTKSTETGVRGTNFFGPVQVPPALQQRHGFVKGLQFSSCAGPQLASRF